jgi:hypothetical protein
VIYCGAYRQREVDTMTTTMRLNKTGRYGLVDKRLDKMVFTGDHWDRFMFDPNCECTPGNLRCLWDDADYYTDPYGPDGIDDHGATKRSAQAVKRRIEALGLKGEKPSALG